MVIRFAQTACGQVLVCNPRKNAALKQGNTSDKIDARKLARRLRLKISSRSTTARVGTHAAGSGRSYLTVVRGLTRVMSRVKALYRSWAIPCAGRDLYYTRHRGQ